MKKIIVLIVCCWLGFRLSAQQDEQMSIYMYNPLYFNPAYAGSRDAISMTAVGRFQWVNFNGAPNTQWFSIHAPLLFKSLGVGAHMVNDRIGMRSRTAVYADISGSIKLSKHNQSRLAVGISAGADIIGIDFANATVNDLNDPFYGQKLSSTKMNVGAGVYVYGDKYYVGLSTPRVLIEKLKDANSVVQAMNARHFFLAAGYVAKLNSVLKLKPSTLVKFTPNAPITFDLNLSLLSYDILWTGLMYRFNESVGVNVGVIIKKVFTIGYVYDFPYNGLRKYQSGSHEIFLSYDLHTKKMPFTSPRYF